MAKQKTSKTRTPKINLRGVGEFKAATGIFNNRHAVDQKTGKKSSQKIGMRGQGGTPVVPLTASKGKETREIGSIRKMDEDYRIALRESKARWAGMSRDERVALRTARFATVEAAEKAFGRFMSHTENKQTPYSKINAVPHPSSNQPMRMKSVTIQRTRRTRGSGLSARSRNVEGSNRFAMP